MDFLYILPVNPNTPSNMEFEKLSSPLFQWVAKTPAVSLGGLLRNYIAKIQLRKGLYAWPNSMGISEAKQLPGLSALWQIGLIDPDLTCWKK